MRLFKHSFGLTRNLFILYVHEHDRLGFGMYLIAFVVQSRQKRSVLSFEHCFESVEEYSEGKIHKSELEPRNANV